MLVETSEEETKTSSSSFSKENLNIIQQDDQPSSMDDDERQINTLTRERGLQRVIRFFYEMDEDENERESRKNI